MELTREKTYGITGSILCCIVLLLILYFTFLRTEIKQKEEGVLVHFGTVNLTAGTFTPKGEVKEATPKEASPSPPVQKAPEVPAVPNPKPQKPQTKPSPPPITQNLEQTAAIEAAKQKQREKAAAEQAAREAAKAEQARLEEEQRKRDAINRQVSGAFGAGNANLNGQGAGQSGAGTQGNPQGVPSAAPSGGGYGEFNLGGRTLGSEGLPRPDYSASEEGNIVVNIVVDPRGNVILAEIGKGTTINSVAMRNSALKAARMAKFSSINGNNNQSGTITYRYYLK